MYFFYMYSFVSLHIVCTVQLICTRSQTYIIGRQITRIKCQKYQLPNNVSTTSMFECTAQFLQMLREMKRKNMKYLCKII